MRIVLVGYMGAGKTTIGKRLAKLMDWEFIDTDTVFCEKLGMGISEYFRIHGEAEFRVIEREILKEMLLRDNIILSTGGGTPCYADNMQLIKDSGVSVYIRSNPKTLHERVSYRPWKRPMLNAMEGEDGYYFICQQLREREPFYNQAAITLKGEGLKPQTIKEEVENYINL